jgi:phenylpyruvate tautomerase PptA (4-oxalocrotonate tautomerase family)
VYIHKNQPEEKLMPTYMCSLPANRYAAGQKQAIAQAIAVNHSAATNAPPNLVHVVLQDSPGTMRFVGGMPEEEHIWVIGYIREGRDDETIGKLMLGIARSISRITGMDEHFVWVYICPIASAHMVKYGSVHPQPGDENPWFEAMPEQVRAYMKRQTPPEDAKQYLDDIFRRSASPENSAAFSTRSVL